MFFISLIYHSFLCVSPGQNSLSSLQLKASSVFKLSVIGLFPGSFIALIFIVGKMPQEMHSIRGQEGSNFVVRISALNFIFQHLSHLMEDFPYYPLFSSSWWQKFVLQSSSHVSCETLIALDTIKDSLHVPKKITRTKLIVYWS